MTREEARKFKAKNYFELYDYIDAKVVAKRINKIYDDFEARTCKSCNYWNPHRFKCSQEVKAHGMQVDFSCSMWSIT